MQSFGQRIAPYVDAEVQAAQAAESSGDYKRAFAHLERAHVLGQASTFLHVRVHWLMFVWGCRRANTRECMGQILRIIGAATKTAFGLVPAGNTGGANVSPFKPMPVAPDLKALIESASSGH